MQAVKIHIRSEACDNQDTAKMEQWAEGELAEREGKFYCIYEETAEGLEGTKTTLKWDDSSLVINRSGAVSCRQEFKTGYVCQSVYQTAYLKMALSTETVYLCTDRQEGRHSISVEYKLAQEGQFTGRFRVLIEVEEQSEH